MVFDYIFCEKCGGERGVIRGRALQPCPYPTCNPRPIRRWNRGRFVNCQVGEKEASAVAIHPVTGEEVYCFGDDPSKPLPEQYAKEGFEKVSFNHFRDLEKFCRERGMVNDIEGDWHKDDGYFEEQQSRSDKQHSEQMRAYKAEREKVKRAMREEMRDR